MIVQQNIGQTAGKQQHAVDESKDFRCWLMNGTHDRPAGIGKIMQGLHNMEGGGWIKAGRGLVQQQHLWLHQQLQGYAHPAKHGINQEIAQKSW